MRFAHAPIIAALRDPAVMAAFTAADWDLLVRQGLESGLLGRLAAMAQRAGLAARIPRAVWHHMEAALTIAERQQRAVQWEVSLLAHVLPPAGVPVVLLKGAAYAAAGLPPAAGRTFSDIDILVPKATLSEVEKHLMLAGWITSHLDAYDQRYYRQWMHELPPMTHIRRGTQLDVHHNILPETARIRARPELILAAARPLADHDGMFVPCHQDLVLHSATHLFHEGEWEHGLRDLSDLDCLLRAHGDEEGYWPTLLKRAQDLNLTVPLGYALRLTRRVFATPIPDMAMAWCTSGPGARGGAWMDAIFLQGLGAAHWSLGTAWTGPARLLLYIRSHWLRMPPHLLLPHLTRKALKREDPSQRTKEGTATRNARH